MKRIYAVVRMTNVSWSGTTSFHRYGSTPAVNAILAWGIGDWKIWPWNWGPEEVEAEGERLSTDETYYAGFRLIVTQDHTDVVNAIPDGHFMDRTKKVRGGGETYLFVWDDQSKIDEASLGTSSYRLEVLTTNAWQFDFALLWGETDDGSTVPLALHEGKTTLSTDPTESYASLPIRPVPTLSDNDDLARLLVIVTTHSGDTSGVPSPGNIRLRVEKTNGEVARDAGFPETPQSDLKPGWTNIYEFHVEPGLRTREIQQIILRNQGSNMWAPFRIRIFGASQGGVIPIVDQGGLPRLRQQGDGGAGDSQGEVSLTLL